MYNPQFVELKDTWCLMTSTDWKKRFAAEYWQTKIRYEKLHKLIVRRSAGLNDFETPISLEMWNNQAKIMGMYLFELEKQAVLHGIDLEKDFVQNPLCQGEKKNYD